MTIFVDNHIASPHQQSINWTNNASLPVSPGAYRSLLPRLCRIYCCPTVAPAIVLGTLIHPNSHHCFAWPPADLLLLAPHTKLITAPSPHTPNTLRHQRGNKKVSTRVDCCVFFLFSSHIFELKISRIPCLCAPHSRRTYPASCRPSNMGRICSFTLGWRRKNDGGSDREVGLVRGFEMNNRWWRI
jgi:hypothetical protein